MIIYMVEQHFARADWEQEWSDWYNGNLNLLLSVPGFRSAQRFRNAGESPRYLAVYTVDSPAVFQTQTYINAGGNGANSVRFRLAYQLWQRNLFDISERAIDVPTNQFLLVEDVADSGAPLRPGAQRLTCTGMHKTTPFRDLTVLPKPLDTLPANVLCYRPLTPRLGQLYRD
ncbi:MAG: hypothetical protein FJY56_05445 [Betaproteobacteria bacterium]|nr:hypothetical protein [Betaproteobacteria bacterium]